MTTLELLTPPAGGMLIASSSASLRKAMIHRFGNRRWPVEEAMGGADALVKLELGDWQVLYLDRRLPDLNAEELVEIVHGRFPQVHVEMVDSEETPDAAISTRGHNAFSFSPAPAPRRNLETDDVRADTRPMPIPIGAPEIEPLPAMVGRSATMQRLYRLTRLVAPRSTTILILGPTGTGKELVARALHELSPRASRSFVVVNCAAIPEALLESELFGYARGAFTGAVQSFGGRIQAAQGGTLFLDEVGELPLGTQAKLLRFLDHKEIQRLGTAETVRVDVRVLAATNVDLMTSVTEGKFRQDLFYRLACFPLELPPLSERKCDIQPLAEHFLQSMAAASRSLPMTLSVEAIHVLQGYEWAGNVRELQQALERAAILADSAPVILPEHLQFPISRSAGIAAPQFVAPQKRAL